ncbi:MAG: protein kinase, partial [Gemmataceae bacterium]|nr:protein kinase [Gemmataceae bacterium]
NLWDRFRECRNRGLSGIPRSELLRYMEEAAEAIDLMNIQYQIQHLDIKPQNLFLVANHVKVGDFGLAKLLDGVSASVTGGVTPVYAAPETFEGRVSRFCDQYSLAIVYQELLTGTRPFQGTNTRQLLMQHLAGTPEVAPLPEADRAVILRALQKTPEERWPNCMEMVQALRAAGEGKMTLWAGGTAALAEGPETRTQPTPPPTHAVSGIGSASALATRVAPLAAIPASPTGVSAAAVSTGDGPRTHPTAPAFVPPAGGTPPRASGPLSTPRLVTPSTLISSPAGGLRCRSDTGAPPRSQLMPRAPSLPPERTGDGVLIPTCIIGLGNGGQRVVEALQNLLRQHWGDVRSLPHLRFLTIDTDPQVASAAGATVGSPTVLTPSPATTPTSPVTPAGEAAFFWARLQRPAHYLQQAHLPSLDRWLPPGSLARLGRQPGTAQGVRAFGRLALLDHSRPLLARLRRELQALLTEEPLQQAAAHTRLTLRSNRPHFYLIADLGGGSGSGMFLDLAYWLRHELRRLGCPPSVHALLLLPPVDPRALRTPATTLALGNTCAALVELEYFQSGRGVYQAYGDTEEGTWTENAPPFGSIHMLMAEPASYATVVADAARFLLLRLLTPLGRFLDQHPPAEPASVQLVGLYHFYWPRRELLDQSAAQLARWLLRRWYADDPVTREQVCVPVSTWLDQQWHEHRLTTEQLLTAFRNELTNYLRDDPDHYCDTQLQTLRTQTPTASKIDGFAVCQVLDQFLRLVGKPEADPAFPVPICETVFASAYERLLRESDTALSVLAVQLLEMPGYRFAGAEEALRQVELRLDAQIAAVEQTHQDLQRQVRLLYQRLLQLIAQLEQGGTLLFGLRRSALVQEILEALRVYPQRQLQLQMVGRLLPLLRHLRDAAPEFLRDLALCRQALRQLENQLDQLCPPPSGTIGSGCRLLPGNATEPAAAAASLIEQLCVHQAHALEAWEQRLQQALQRKFRGLGNVCLKVAAKGADFCQWLLEQCRAFLDPHLPRHDPAAAFFQVFASADEAAQALHTAVDEAAPAIAAAGHASTDNRAVVLLPATDAGHRLAQQLIEISPTLSWQVLHVDEQLCLYRETVLPLRALPHLGPLGQQAYEQLLATEHPPHSRVDIPWTLPAKLPELS